MKFIQRFFNNPKQSFFLFGPRGTGKSTLIRELYKDALWIDLLDPEVFRAYSARPERLFDVARDDDMKKGTIVIDEVQKVPSLLDVTHALIEENKNLQFVLTGSSARKIKRVGADLLAGRALLRKMHPFMAAELRELFSLEKAITIGMLPVLWRAENPADALQAYVGLYLKEEVQEEGLVRSVESFSRFLEAISFSHASVLNLNNVARECEVKRKTVENYVEILEDLMLAYKVPVFTKRAKREMSVHPKLYLFDAGVFRALRPKGLLDRVEEIEGAALEGLVMQHLRAWNDLHVEKYDISFWKTRSGVEVDFVVYGLQGFWGIEVKNSKKVHSIDLKPLETFLSDYPMAKGIFLYRGNERLKIGQITCLPCEDFLLGLKPNKLF